MHAALARSDASSSVVSIATSQNIGPPSSGGAGGVRSFTAVDMLLLRRAIDQVIGSDRMG